MGHTASSWPDHRKRLGELQPQSISRKRRRLVITARDVQLSNMARRKANRRHMCWTPIRVERDGRNPVGTVPSLHPQSRACVFRLSHAAMDRLEMEFNLPVGKFGGATLAMRQHAVLEYLTEG